jgi:hypothetical protein
LEVGRKKIEGGKVGILKSEWFEVGIRKAEVGKKREKQKCSRGPEGSLPEGKTEKICDNPCKSVSHLKKI